VNDSVEKVCRCLSRRPIDLVCDVKYPKEKEVIVELRKKPCLLNKEILLRQSPAKCSMISMETIGAGGGHLGSYKRSNVAVLRHKLMFETNPGQCCPPSMNFTQESNEYANRKWHKARKM
jgi:hypothetical protein